MPSYSLAKFSADQPNLWAPLLLPACLFACDASAGATTTFDVARFSPAADEPSRETWSLVHPPVAPTAPAPTAAPEWLDQLDPASREDLLHLAAACVIVAILRASEDLRVARVSRRGPWLDFHLETADGSEAGVLAAFGTAEADTSRALANVARHVEGAPGGQKFAGAVAFGTKMAAIRVFS